MVNVAQRPAACPAFPSDYEKSAAVTSDILPLSSLQMNAHYGGRTGRDYCCVGPETCKRKRKKKRRMWVRYVMCDKQVIADYF
jgi:hypothetical protein